jgi:hypothetical protein
LPESVADWVTAHGLEITVEDVEMAVEAGERVAGEKSELAELWVDADEPEWRESLDDLTERLRVALRGPAVQAQYQPQMACRTRRRRQLV